jgi:Tol biopolymer transport system component
VLGRWFEFVALYQEETRKMVPNWKMMNVVVLIALVIGALFLLAACQPNRLTPTLQAAEEDVTEETAVVSPTEEMEVTTEDPQPDVSADAEGIVFSTTDALTRLTETPGDEYHAAWSPDGRWLLFTYWEGNTYALGTYDLETGSRALLNAEVTGDLYLDWMPDGAAFVFDGSTSGGPSSIFLAEFPADLSNPLQTEQLDVPTPAFMTTLSPDGKQVLFFHDNQLKTFDLETQTTEVISNTEGCWHPQFSPNGTSVLFTKEADGAVDIYSMALDGVGLTKLTDSSRNFDRARWSPDGSMIVYVAEEGGQTEIWLTELATGKTLRLIAFSDETEAYLSMPEFAPDGDAIVVTYDGDLWLVEGLSALDWE